jgi:Mn2+/Fe2+ NRAMP family transporter
MENICEQIFQNIIDECMKEKNKNLLNAKVLDPIIVYVGRQLIPYLVFSVVVISVFLSVLIAICIQFLTKSTLKV